MKTLFVKQSLFIVIVILAGCKSDDHTTLPEIITSAISIITPISGVCIANVDTGNGSMSERGVCWSTDSMPEISDQKAEAGPSSTGEFSALISGLTPATVYHARAFATNEAGTAYGEDIKFTTPEDHSGETSFVTDADGNTYPVIGIGAQFWMAQNLRTTKFNDGTDIPLKENNADWQSMSTPAYCWYNNEENTYKPYYGALYNWYAVITPKLAPVGWHVSSDADWLILETYVSGLDALSGKLKETGTVHWNDPNTGATNESGFTALPGGIRAASGSFSGIGVKGVFWTSTSASNGTAWFHSFDYQSENIIRNAEAVGNGGSVRCVKD